MSTRTLIEPQEATQQRKPTGAYRRTVLKRSRTSHLTDSRLLGKSTRKSSLECTISKIQQKRYILKFEKLIFEFNNSYELYKDDNFKLLDIFIEFMDKSNDFYNEIKFNNRLSHEDKNNILLTSHEKGNDVINNALKRKKRLEEEKNKKKKRKKEKKKVRV